MLLSEKLKKILSSAYSSRTHASPNFHSNLKFGSKNWSRPLIRAIAMCCLLANATYRSSGEKEIAIILSLNPIYS